jgi:hypothetical protein
MLSLGVNQGRISLERLVELCCENNAKVFGLFPKKGTIRVGSDGDLVVVDLNKKATVRPEMLYTSSGWSIYEGWEFAGWPVLTIVRGHRVAEGRIRPTRWKWSASRSEDTSLERSVARFFMTDFRLTHLRERCLETAWPERREFLCVID